MRLTSEVHGTGDPIVCLPAFGMSVGVMASAFEPAMPDGFQRIYVDLPGVGSSPGGPADSDAVLDTVMEFTAQWDRFLLAGWSYGGYLAAGLARRLPSRVAGLLLVCHGVRIENRDLPTDVIEFEQPVNPRDEEYLQRLRTNGYRLSDEDSTAVYSGPACVVTGRGDGVVGYADQFRVLSRYPRATYTVVADAGHFVPFEQPELFASLVRSWLA